MYITPGLASRYETKDKELQLSNYHFLCYSVFVTDDNQAFLRLSEFAPVLVVVCLNTIKGTVSCHSIINAHKLRSAFVVFSILCRKQCSVIVFLLRGVLIATGIGGRPGGGAADAEAVEGIILRRDVRIGDATSQGSLHKAEIVV